MYKEDNQWEFSSKHKDEGDCRDLEINTCRYYVSDDSAAICHAILLLVDAINDKKI